MEQPGRQVPHFYILFIAHVFLLGLLLLVGDILQTYWKNSGLIISSRHSLPSRKINTVIFPLLRSRLLF
jgi:hypothetical protein